MKTDNILEMRGISKSFPGVKALKGINFTVRKGEVHCLAGANGAGKSTLMKILSGAYQADSGEIWIEGQKVHLRNPIDALKAGIGTIYQELSVVPKLTAAENIFLNNYPQKGLIVDWRKISQLSRDIFAEIGIKNIDVDRPVETLTIGHQQLVELVKVLVQKAKIVIMDEPSATLSAEEFNVLKGVIKDLKKKGITIIYISHRLEELLELGDRVTVLRDGSLVGTFNIKDLDHDRLVELIVGHPLTAGAPNQGVSEGKEVVLALKDVSNHKLKKINLSVRSGEVVGLFGLVGSGRTEVLRVIFGADKINSGSIEFFGQPINPKAYSPTKACQMGCALVPENRKREGLVLGLTVWENSILPALNRFSKYGLIKSRQINTFVAEQIKNLRVKTPSQHICVSKLSGGNQQKVVIAKWLLSESRLFLFDEPTQGIDVGAKEEIYGIINHLASLGKSIIIASSELRELTKLCNRIIVMYDGCFVEEFYPASTREEKILQCAVAGRKGMTGYGSC
ncbi:ABC-type sugar transport system, ATPase component [Moorella thermoacetica Y72]|uniref:ABC-type sugar transport system, ATPase component n=1 Tax=Moorella thermoacetica Y72 TaxID=1325331 RepID=A0A0S6U8C8_NEOTH|nr:sugar ABC transporter ATP-binding protein [Moorella thermoacetica]GAF25361.1 ABC-type sugar transport system, ATPase component [Moorella thermoacetica Y72]